jgi:hypothetical protein
MPFGDDQCNQNEAGNQHPNRVALFKIGVFETEIWNIADHQGSKSIDHE